MRLNTATPLLALVVTACAAGAGSTSDVADYTLQVLPVTPLNQSGLFQDAADVTLWIEPEAGDPTPYSLSNVSSGSSSKVTDLPALDGATLSLEVRDAGGNLTAFGRSERLTLQTGESETRMLVSRVERFGWTAGLPDDRAGGALVADGTGRFLLFGGSSRGSNGATSIKGESGVNTVFSFQVAPPNSELRVEQLDATAPPIEDFAGRVAFTATRLTGQYADQGKILIAGGSSDWLDSENASGIVWLWDPTDDSYTRLSKDAQLSHARFLHTATEDAAGNVILAGGLGQVESGYITPVSSIERYDATNQETKMVNGDPASPLFLHAAARLGSQGVLLCGGIAFHGGTDISVSDQCDLVTLSGALEAGFTTLPQPLYLAELTPLADGSVLLTGGFARETTDPFNYTTTTLEATAEAWVFDGSSWSQVDDMPNPRGAHAAVALPDGRVLVVGGSPSQRGNWFSGVNAIACAAVFDPASGSWSEVPSSDGQTTCDASSSTGPLPNPVVWPMVAVDPDYGVFVAGGVGRSEDGLEDAVLFVPTPPDR